MKRWRTRILICLLLVAFTTSAVTFFWLGLLALMAEWPTPEWIWLGLGVGTVVYGLMSRALLSSAIHMLREEKRKRRGLCRECAYDLRGDLDAGCPECGWNRAEVES